MRKKKTNKLVAATALKRFNMLAPMYPRVLLTLRDASTTKRTRSIRIHRLRLILLLNNSSNQVAKKCGPELPKMQSPTLEVRSWCTRVFQGDKHVG